MEGQTNCLHQPTEQSGKRRMNQLLQKAFLKASRLPEVDQTRFARFLLAELEANRQWETLFFRPESEDLLEYMADEALADHHAGLTSPLSPKKL